MSQKSCSLDTTRYSWLSFLTAASSSRFSTLSFVKCKLLKQRSRLHWLPFVNFNWRVLSNRLKSSQLTYFEDWITTCVQLKVNIKTFVSAFFTFSLLQNLNVNSPIQSTIWEKNLHLKTATQKGPLRREINISRFKAYLIGCILRQKMDKSNLSQLDIKVLFAVSLYYGPKINNSTIPYLERWLHFPIKHQHE